MHVSGGQQDEKRRKQVLDRNPYRAYSGYPEAESACTAETGDSVSRTRCEKSQLKGDKKTRPTWQQEAVRMIEEKEQEQQQEG